MRRSEVQTAIDQLSQQIESCQQALLDEALPEDAKLNIQAQMERQQGELEELKALLDTLPEEEVPEDEEEVPEDEEEVPEDADYTYTPWTLWTLLDDWKNYKKREVYQVRKQKEALGITVVGTEGGQYKFDTSLTGRSNAMGVLNAFAMGVLDPASSKVHWKFADGTFADITYEQLKELSMFTLIYLEQLFQAEGAHYAAIDALEDVDAVKMYNANDGWPSNQFDGRSL